MKVSYNITQNKFNANLNQETTEIKVKFQTGYYPLPGGGGGDLSNYYTKDETYSKTEVDDIISDIPVIDTSNLVPYTGANKDVNIGNYLYKTSKGFDFTYNNDNYFRAIKEDNKYYILEFKSKDDSDDDFGSIDLTVTPEVGLELIKKDNNGLALNSFSINNLETFSLKPFVSDSGFKIPTGTATQALTANGEVFDLNTKADLVGGKIPASQLPSYVDDVLEFANLASFPATGENGKIYIAIDTNLTYRWGGSSYVVMSSSLALGETSSTAYRGDRGKIAYNHSQATGNAHDTKLEELSDVSGDATTIIDTDVILKKESGGFWKKITFANFKNWFTTELAKKINIGLDTVFNLKNISAMTLNEFRSITPDIETIYFTEEQNSTGWQQIRYNGLGITIPATTETKISITDENYIELDSDSTFNLIDVANTKINGIFEKDFVIIKFNAGVVTPATTNQWFKVILKINGVQTAVSPVFYLTESSGTVEQIAHNFALNVPAEMVTNGATLHLKTSTNLKFNNPAISVARVHKSTNANL